MRFPRQLAIGLAAAAVSAVVVLATAPLFFRDRIASRVRTELAAAVNARLAWDGVGLGLLRDFPNVSITVDRPSAVGLAPFAGDTLAVVRQVRLVLDVASVVRHLTRGGPVVVREIVVRGPVVHLRVLADGRANWDIARPRGGASPAPAHDVRISLRDLRITDGQLTIDDQQSRVVGSVSGLQESLRGDFARERFVLATRTRADSVSLRFAGIPYLSRASVALDADLNANLPARRFIVDKGSIRLNHLALALTGGVALGTPNLAMDLAFAAPSTAFADILSLVPAVYRRDFARMQTAGTMSASGRVRGQLGPHAFPMLALRARVQDGAFRYAALPLAARGISLDLAIDNPGGHADSTVVSLERLRATIGARPLEARLVMRTPVSDPDVDLRVVGGLDLADLARTVALDGVSGLSGVVSADIAMHARLSDADGGRYDRIAARGIVHASRVTVRPAALPHAVAIDTAELQLAPRAAALTAFAARAGHSDLRATGAVDNLLAYLLRGDDLRGNAVVASTQLDLDEWRSNETTTTVIPVPPRVDFTLKASAARVTYGALAAANVHGGLHVKDQRVTLDELLMETLRGTVAANGYYDTRSAGRPVFDVDFRLASVDIPSAFASLTTVQRLAPIARWAQGAVSGTVGLRGMLGQDMTPVLPTLAGKGALATDHLVMQGAPVLGKLADAFRMEPLRAPTLGAMRASFDVADGRLHVKPFAVRVGGVDMTVGGSNGVDQSLAYDVSVAVPHAALAGGGAPIPLGAQVTGTVTHPRVTLSAASLGSSARAAAMNVVQQAGSARLASGKLAADSAAGEARRRAQAEAERLAAEAEQRAAAIRGGARAMADSLRHAGSARADSLVARASNPVARMGAQVAADRMRRESDQQAERLVRDADARADSVVAKARRLGTVGRRTGRGGG